MATANALMKEASAEQSGEKKITPQIEAQNVKLNADGFCWREYLVELSPGMTADDVRSPEIWRTYQGNPNRALNAGDTLRIYGPGREWCIPFAMVAQADRFSVQLVGISKIIPLPARSRPFMNDGINSVYSQGGLYGVKRMADGVKVDGFFDTEAAAELALRNMTPQQVR